MKKEAKELVIKVRTLIVFVSRIRSLILENLKQIKFWHIMLLSILLLLFILPEPFQRISFKHHQKTFYSHAADSLKVVNTEKQLKKDILLNKSKLDRAVPKSYYMVINSTSNTFNLYKTTELVHHGKCSTGSYLQLEKDEKQKWLFKTPKGVFTIKGKTTNPVWRKPDWAFIEEGIPVPSINAQSRYESGVLGDYALALGQGYMIHGTLYQRYLGLPVTHGCVRLNDADLELIYKSLEIDSKVFIY